MIDSEEDFKKGALLFLKLYLSDCFSGNIFYLKDVVEFVKDKRLFRENDDLTAAVLITALCNFKYIERGNIHSNSLYNEYILTQLGVDYLLENK